MVLLPSQGFESQWQVYVLKAIELQDPSFYLKKVFVSDSYRLHSNHRPCFRSVRKRDVFFLTVLCMRVGFRSLR